MTPPLPVIQFGRFSSPEQLGASLWPVDPPSLPQVRSALLPYLAEVSFLELLHVGELAPVLARAQSAKRAPSTGPISAPLPPRLPRTGWGGRRRCRGAAAGVGCCECPASPCAAPKAEETPRQIR